MSIGQFIRQIRDERDLSLREFAKKIDCSPAFVSDVELGRRYPSDEVLATIAKVLGTTPDELKRYDTRPPTEELKRQIAINPRYALAFRTLADSKVSPEEILRFAKKKSEEAPKKK